MEFLSKKSDKQLFLDRQLRKVFSCFSFIFCASGFDLMALICNLLKRMIIILFSNTQHRIEAFILRGNCDHTKIRLFFKIKNYFITLFLFLFDQPYQIP